jgi:spore coat protein U-like protein
MTIRHLAGAAMLAGTLAFAMPAQATPDTGSVAVSATLTAVCYIGDGTLAFGNIASIGQGGTAGTRADTGDTSTPTSAIAYVCSNGATASLSIAGANDSSGQLRMSDGAHYLPYNIYSDSEYSSQVMPVDTSVSLTADGTNKTITLYGVVPGATANQQIGDYTDTLTLNVSY